ncbi:unnamed protein product [Lactuca saligna]|uniref:Uncharacterized protein n=1 Tax=Lactuca saligna TaxID=75948 RepID=A0AA35V2X5_LACSI|nr:unnamed protein product [Lactuca saligna]
MGMEGNKQTILSNYQKNTTYKKSNPKLTLLPLIALIFYEVSRGPFGVEDSVKSGGGALLSLLGFLIFPIFWSIPKALITTELATSSLKTAVMSSGYHRRSPFLGFPRRVLEMV